MKKVIIAIVGLVLFFSCSSTKENTAVSTEGEMGSSEMRESTEESDNIERERKLIKSGEIRFETSSIATVRTNIFQSVKKHKGYVSSDNTQNYSGKVSNTIVVRVPADDFNELLAEVTVGVSSFDSKSIVTKDVTEDFLDISARLKTKKELEIRYLELLKKAVTVREIMEVEQQIGLLRSEIESVEGRLKYLESRVSFSTLSLTFYKNTPVVEEFSNDFGIGFRNGWNNFMLFLLFLVTVWPFLLLLVVSFFALRFYRKKRLNS